MTANVDPGSGDLVPLLPGLWMVRGDVRGVLGVEHRAWEERRVDLAVTSCTLTVPWGHAAPRLDFELAPCPDPRGRLAKRLSSSAFLGGSRIRFRGIELYPVASYRWRLEGMLSIRAIADWVSGNATLAGCADDTIEVSAVVGFDRRDFGLVAAPRLLLPTFTLQLAARLAWQSSSE